MHFFCARSSIYFHYIWGKAAMSKANVSKPQHVTPQQFDFGVNCPFNHCPGNLCFTLLFWIVYEHFSLWCPLHVINMPCCTLRSKRRSHWGDLLGRRHRDNIYTTKPWLLIVGKTANSTLWCKIRHLMAVFFKSNIVVMLLSLSLLSFC